MRFWSTRSWGTFIVSVSVAMANALAVGALVMGIGRSALALGFAVVIMDSVYCVWTGWLLAQCVLVLESRVRDGRQ